MSSRTLLSRFAGWRLTLLLSLIFLGLALPTGVLIWQAYGQLKWEAWYQYRGMAEELTRRIDLGLREHVTQAEQRSFADYGFLVLAGDPSANFLQRSPLAALPVDTGPPGVIGYFQVDAEGGFSTPLLPPDGTDPASVGIGAEEHARRVVLAERLRTILADNRLVRRPPARAEPGRARADAKASSDEAAGATAGEEGQSNELETSYSQQIFDELGRYAASPPAASARLSGERAVRDAAAPAVPAGEDVVVGKVSDLNLEAAYPAEGPRQQARPLATREMQPEARAKRTEQTSLPEAAPEEPMAFAVPEQAANLRISTFESELDPFEFSLLDSGHFVLFRKVWRDDQRYIQGMLIEPDEFLEATIGAAFEEAALSAMSNLVIAWHDNVLRGAGAPESLGRNRNGGLEGTLLYRGRLSAPLGSLGLIYSIERLPPGPGARVLSWVTLVLGLVFAGGFYALHRLARGQLELARQQQDFVSAVSHELKTPLTSIRMYGEMLKEGWVSDDKRAQYYAYIHDESERLARLIANVLELARITRNEAKPTLRELRVADLMDTVTEKVSGHAERAGFELVFEREREADGALLRVDEDSFLQIVINLVDNAIKFSAGAADKRIDIGSRLSGKGKIVFSVRDYGPGVPRNQMKKIFELFYRSGDELTRETVGTGIGLAIVHQLTQSMNGTVDVVNRSPGAEFRLSFPRF